MAEGKYGRLPKPKDHTRINVRMGNVALSPIHDKASEWEEEGDVYRPKPAPHPQEESIGSRIAKALANAATQATASVRDVLPERSAYAALLDEEEPK